MDPLITDLLMLADEVLPATDFALKQYWFRFRGPHAINVTLVIDQLQGFTGIIARSGDVDVAGIDISPTATIRILNSARRVIEVVGGSETTPSPVRCVLAPDAKLIIDVDVELARP
jgi:hypothetical protein